MAHDTQDEPAGRKDAPATPDHDDDSAVVEKHRALQNQDSVKPSQYPRQDRQDQSLVRGPREKSGD